MFVPFSFKSDFYIEYNERVLLITNLISISICEPKQQLNERCLTQKGNKKKKTKKKKKLKTNKKIKVYLKEININNKNNYKYFAI